MPKGKIWPDAKGQDLARFPRPELGQMLKGKIWPDAKGQDLAKCQRAGYATILLRYKILLRCAARSVAA